MTIPTTNNTSDSKKVTKRTLWQRFVSLTCTGWFLSTVSIALLVILLRQTIAKLIASVKEGPNKNSISPQSPNLQKVTDKLSAAEEREVTLKARDGCRHLHKTIRQHVALNPFWKRTVIYETSPEELNKSSHVYFSNHTSFSDFIFVSGLDLDYTAVAKGDLLDVPVFGKVSKNAGMLPVYFYKKPDGKWTTDKVKVGEMLSLANCFLRNGLSIFVFPEGRINLGDDLLEFKPGFFNVAKEAQTDVVPVAIWGANDLWPMARKEVPSFQMAPGDCYVKVGTPMDILRAEDLSEASTSKDIHVLLLEKYSLKELSEELKDAIDECSGALGSEADTNLLDEKVDEVFKLTVKRKIRELRNDLELLAQSK